MSWYTARPLQQHTRTVRSHREWHSERAACNDVSPLAQFDSPGLGIQEAVDKFHIIWVHGVIMVLHKETGKLQSKHRKSFAWLLALQWISSSVQLLSKGPYTPSKRPTASSEHSLTTVLPLVWPVRQKSCIDHTASTCCLLHCVRSAPVQDAISLLNSGWRKSRASNQNTKTGNDRMKWGMECIEKQSAHSVDSSDPVSRQWKSWDVYHQMNDNEKKT